MGALALLAHVAPTRLLHGRRFGSRRRCGSWPRVSQRTTPRRPKRTVPGTARPDPYLAPPASPQRLSGFAIVADVARHALPLISLYRLHGSIPGYLLLTAFDLSLSLVAIVGTTRDRRDPTSVDPRSRWLVMRALAVLVLAVFFAVMAAILTVPIGMPALIIGMAQDTDWWNVVSQRGFWMPVAIMALLAAARSQLQFEATTSVGSQGPAAQAAPVMGDLAADRRRSLADYAAQVTLIATFVGLCFAMASFGRWGLYALPALYAAMQVLYDARPDIARRLLPTLWEKSSSAIGG